MSEAQLLPHNLEYFSKVYRMGNYAAAARAIPITYQGLRKSVRILELDLGVTLFEESREGDLVPTPYADELFKLSQAWVHDIGELNKMYRQIRASGRSVVNLVAITGFKNYLDKGFEDRFASRYPGLSLDIVEYPDSTIDDFLEEGLLDMAVVAQPCLVNLDFTPLAYWNRCAWVPKNHRLASLDHLELKDLDGENIMIPDAHFKTSDIYQAAIDDKLFTPRSVSYCASIFDSFIFALKGQGIGIGASFLDESIPEVEGVVSIMLDDGLEREVSLAIRKGYELSEQEQKLVDFLRSELPATGE